MPRKSIYLAAGGTGGHIFPAVALGEMLANDGWQVALLTDRRGRILLDQTDNRLPLYQIMAGSPFAGNLLRRLLAHAKLAIGFVQSALLLRSGRPGFVLGFGGYPSAPPLLAASWLKIPAGLHEQNARIGRANLFLARRCGHLLTSWPDSQPLPDNVRITETGLPVRAAFFDQPKPNQAPQRLALLVAGGSLGAALFAQLLPAAIGRLDPALRQRLDITQQVRADQAEMVRAAYEKMNIVAELASFFADMPQRMGRADLVICRAGASSVAEVAAAGRAAIFIPFAAALDNHQMANAASLADQGAARILAEEAGSKPENLELMASRLAGQMEELLGDSSLRNNIADLARARGRPRACQAIAQTIEARLTDLEVNAA